MSLSGRFLEFFRKESVVKALEKLKKDKKILIILLLGISGMAIIMLIPTKEETKNNTSQSIVRDYDNVNIEYEIKELIESIKGAGEARVYITYESDSENVYAVNTDEKSDGGEIHFKSEYVITDDETGIILKVLYPKVRGVAVVCKGGSDPVVKEKIYSVLSALFDISTNKISVADMA